MIVKELLQPLTKYYIIAIIDERDGVYTFDDQSVVPDDFASKKVASIDFYEDSGEGESIVVHTLD
jgi:hypothetical protein